MKNRSTERDREKELGIAILLALSKGFNYEFLADLYGPAQAVKVLATALRARDAKIKLLKKQINTLSRCAPITWLP